MRQAHSSGLSLDQLDFDIIRVVSADPDLTNRAVASALGLSESTCAYRIRRLRDSDAIRPRRLELDYDRLGYTLRAVVMVFLTKHSRDVVDSIMSSMAKAPHVLQVTNLTGRYDVMVTVAVADSEQLRNFVLDHVTVHPSVRGAETHIIYDRRDGEWVPDGPV